MELITTYPAAVNSKATVTMGVLDQATTIVEVLDATVLPEAPNLLVLGTDQTAETVLMTARENNTLTIQRAVQGIAKSWPAGTQIARNFTGKDWDDMRSNVEAIATKILGLTASDVGAIPSTDVKLKLYTAANQFSSTIVESTATIGEIISAMPAFSVLDATFWSGQFAAIESEFTCVGHRKRLVIEKGYDNGYTIAHFYDLIGENHWHATFYSEDTSEWSGWVQDFKSDGSVPMSGMLSFKNLAFINQYDAVLEFFTTLSGDISNRTQLSLQGENTLATMAQLYRYENGNGKGYTLFGEHNKPSGSYTGNGSATSRQIAANGIGRLGYIFANTSSGYMTLAIVWNRCAMIFEAGKAVRVTTYDECHLEVDGTITVGTTDYALNENGVEYRYGFF